MIALIIALAALVAAESAYIWWLLGERAQNAGSHARPRPLRPAAAERPDGAAPVPGAGAAPASVPPLTGMPQVVRDQPEPAPDSLEWHAETAAAEHANKMWKLSEPYLQGRPPWETADLPALAEPEQEPRPDVTMSDLPVARPVPDVLPTAAELRDEYFRYMHPVGEAAPTAAGPELARRVIA